MKASFDVFANKKASGSVETAGAFAKDFDIRGSGAGSVMLLNAKMDREFVGSAKDRFASRQCDEAGRCNAGELAGQFPCIVRMEAEENSRPDA